MSSVRLDIWRDAAVGETREALVRDGRVVALNILRATDAGRRARWGEAYIGRVREVDRRRRGAFVDIGLADAHGFLPLGEDGKVRMGRDRVALSQGASVGVRVTREAARGKGAVLDLVETGRDGEHPGLLMRPDCDQELLNAGAASAEVRAGIDSAIEDALAREAAIDGGGALIIEPTSALTAIDVDAGGRAGSGDPERFALDLNIAAAKAAAREVRVRGLGGLIVIDFVSMRSKAHQQELESAVRQAFAEDPWSVQFGGLSRFGLYEMARAQLRTPLHEQVCDVEGRLSVETLALAALRAIEREGRAAGGRQIRCTLAPEVKAWLDADIITWAKDLTNRIGPRWSLEAPPSGTIWPRDKIDARAV